MSQRRTRIQIGPGGPIFVLLSGLVLVSAIYTQANLLFWAFGLLAGGLLASVGVCLLSLRHVQVQRLLPGHGVADDPMIIRYQIANRSWVPVFSLVVRETWGDGRRGWRRAGPFAEQPARLRDRPCGWVLHLGPHQTLMAEAPCWPTRRGPLVFEKIELSSCFPFNILCKVVEWHEPATVLVYPHVYRIKRRLLHSLSHFDPIGRDQLERGGGTEDFFGLRDYRYGDNLRLIDWKRTARTGELITREMTQPSPPRMIILLDLRQHHKPVFHAASDEQPDSVVAHNTATTAPQHRQAAEQGLLPQVASAERAISLTASLICEAHFLGYQTGLAVLGAAFGVFPPHHSLLHRRRMLEALGQLDLDRPVGNAPQRLARPSIIVRLGRGEESPRSETTRVFGADDLEQYVGEAGDVGESVLNRRSHVQSRRTQVQRSAT